MLICGQITEPTPSPTAMGSQMDLTVILWQGTATARVSFVFKYGELQINANAANAAPAWLSPVEEWKRSGKQHPGVYHWDSGGQPSLAYAAWQYCSGNRGVNTGSDFSLAGYSDTGAAINTKC